MASGDPGERRPAPASLLDLTTIQALVFDTYGTVVDWRSGVLAALAALGQPHGRAVDWAALLQDWKTRPIVERINRGELPWMPMEAVDRQALQTIAQLVQARWHLHHGPTACRG